MLPWQQHSRCHSVSFAMYITDAKFENHCSSISGDILDSIFYCCSRAIGLSTSFPGSSLYFEKVPWLRLVTCLSIQTQAAQRVGPQLNFVNTLSGGEYCAATQTLF